MPTNRDRKGGGSGDHSPDLAVEARAVSKVFGLTRRGQGIPVLTDVDVRVSPGEFLAVMGPSGSGKSTLLHCLAGLEPVSDGRVFLSGREITRLGRNRLARLRRAHVAFVFQAYNLVPALNVLDNVALPGWLERKRVPRKRAKEALRDLGLETFARTLPERLGRAATKSRHCARARQRCRDHLRG